MNIIYELKEDVLDIFCERINEIIKEAVVHGGDIGGIYCINQEDLEKSIKRFLDWTGLNKYVVIYKDDIPSLIEKSKISD
jgi:hypothetical protein